MLNKNSELIINCIKGCESYYNVLKVSSMDYGIQNVGIDIADLYFGSRLILDQMFGNS